MSLQRLDCNEEAQFRQMRLDCPVDQDCMIHCTADLCYQRALINATFASNLYLSAAEGDGCFRGSTINLPNNGSAWLVQHNATRAFSSGGNLININAGTNT